MTVRFVLSAACFALMASTAQAQGAPPAGDGPAKCISQKTGIKENKVKACFDKVMKSEKPPAKGEQPSAKGPGKEVQAKLSACLRKENPKLTDQALKTALESCRPDGPPPAKQDGEKPASR